MSVTAMIQAMADAGVTLEIRGDKLRVDAPAGVMTSELRQAIREYKDEILAELSRKACRDSNANVGNGLPSKPEPPGYIHRCSACDGTRWDCVRVEVETLESGQEREFEVWGCLDCAATPTSNHQMAEHQRVCNDCSGTNIVFDQLGAYCVDCRKRLLKTHSQ